MVAIDDSRFHRVIGELRATRLPAREAIRSAGEVFIDVLEEMTPTDTNRLLRGWILAGNDAGLETRLVPPVSPSSRREQVLRALTGQVEFWQGEAGKWQRFMELYEREDLNLTPRADGRPRKKRTRQRYYRKMRRMRDRAEKRLTRAYQELNKAMDSEGVILFDQGQFRFDAAGYRGSSKAYTKSGLRRLTTVRDQVYGGTGTIDRIGDLTVLTLHNLEPHASIIERSARFGHPVATAHGIVKTLGTKRMTKRYVEKARELAEAARKNSGGGGMVGRRAGDAVGGAGRVGVQSVFEVF